MATAQNQTQAAFLNNLLATNISGSTIGALGSNADLARGALNTGYGTARSDVTGQLQPSLSALGTGFDQARTDLTSGYAPAMDAVRSGIAGYQPYVDTGNAANTMYSNALGLNGAAGNTAATGAFQASPGYEWNRNQAIDASARKMNSLGIGGSGNTLDAITRLGENLANQEYGSWLGNLDKAAGRGIQGVAGQAAGDTTLAGLGTGLATNLGNLDTTRGSTTASALTNYGNTLGNLDTGLGTSTANVYTGLGNSIAGVNNNFLSALSQNDTNAGQAQDAANAANQAATRSWAGLGIQGLGVALAPFTGGTSMLAGGLGSSALNNGRLFANSAAGIPLLGS